MLLFVAIESEIGMRRLVSPTDLVLSLPDWYHVKLGGKKPPPADYGAGKMHALPPVRQELPDATRAGGINGTVRDA